MRVSNVKSQMANVNVVMSDRHGLMLDEGSHPGPPPTRGDRFAREAAAVARVREREADARRWRIDGHCGAPIMPATRAVVRRGAGHREGVCGCAGLASLA